MKYISIYIILFLNYSISVFAQQQKAEIILPISHTHRLNTAAFSEDERLLATADIFDARVFIWDIHSGKLLKELQGHQSKVLDLMFTSDGNLLTCGSDSMVIIWDIKRGVAISVFKPPFLAIKSLKHDKNFVELSAKDKKIYRLNKHDGSCQIRANNPGTVYNKKPRSHSPNGTYKIEKKGSKIHLYLKDSIETFFVTQGHENSIHYYLFSENEKILLTADLNLKTQLWDIEKGVRISTLNNHVLSTTSVFYDKNTQNIINTSWNSLPFVWKFNTGELVNSAIIKTDSTWKYPEGVWSCILLPEKGYYIACSEYSNVLHIFEFKSGSYLKSITVQNTEGVWDLQKGIGENEILVSLHSGGVALIDLNEPENQKVFGNKGMPVKKSAVNVFNKSLIAGSIDKKATIYDYKTREIVEESSFTEGVYVVKYSSKGNLYAVGTKNGLVQVFNTQNNDLVYTFQHDTIVHDITFTSDGLFLVSASYDKTIKVWSLNAGTLVRSLEGHKNWCYSVHLTEDDKYLITTGADYQTIVWDFPSGRKLYTRLQLTNNDWLVFDENYRYDGSPGGRELLYFVCETEIIGLTQMKDALYVPGLAEKIMTGQEINYPKLSDLDLCHTLPLIEKIENTGHAYQYKITPRKLGLEQVEVYINNKKVFSTPKKELHKQGEEYFLDLKEEEISKHLLAGTENRINVIGTVLTKEGNELKSRGVGVIRIANKKDENRVTPRLFAVMIGVNDYKDPSLKLNYPVKDVEDLSKALEISTTKLLGKENVFMYLIHSGVKSGKGYSTPEKEGIRKALEDIGKKARPEDIILMFFAGHGVMQGSDEKRFTFLTAEASNLNLTGINTKELQDWLSFEGPHKILANKSILIFDACNSGQATQELVALARNDDQTRRIRQVEDLKDKSGMFILAASAPNQAAYELPQYEQGLLTYSMLSVLKSNPDILDDGQFLNVQKWFLESEKFLKRLVESHGYKQDAQPFGSANIRIGMVDEEVKSNIHLTEEKPVVICANVLNAETLSDGLMLKDLLNKELLNISERSMNNSIGFARQETPDANKINILYQMNGETIVCQIRLMKGSEQLHQASVIGSKNDMQALVRKIIEEVVKYAK